MRAAAGAFRSSGSDYSPAHPSTQAYRLQNVPQLSTGRNLSAKIRGPHRDCASGRKFWVPGPHRPRARGLRHAAKQTIPSNHTRSVEERNFPGASSGLYGRMGAIRQHQNEPSGLARPLAHYFTCAGVRPGAVTMVVLQRPLFKCHNLQVHWLKHCFPCGRCDRIFIGRPRRETQAHRRKTPGKRICNNGRMGNRKIPFLA